jgi:hypothetical protein
MSRKMPNILLSSFQVMKASLRGLNIATPRIASQPVTKISREQSEHINLLTA